MDKTALTGLDLLRAMAASDNAEELIPIGKTMNMIMGEFNEGYARFDAEPLHGHLNPLGMVHGGFAATLLDSAMGCSIHTMLEAGVGYGTIDLNIKYLRPLQPGQKVYAEGNVINISRRLAVADGKLFNEEGKLCAAGNTTCMIYRD